MELLIYIVIGFAAQLIDGTMGMAYGVSCRTFLKTVAGLPSVMVSAIVHCAEIPTSFVSGISHWRLKNVDKKLLQKLLIPGVLGGVIGAYFVSNLGDVLEPFVDLYLIIMGVVIFLKARKQSVTTSRELGKYIYPLGFSGGFLDAVGGGGWGPLVTSTMVASSYDAKKTIGTVNTAEFFITIAQTTTFALLLTDFTRYFYIIIGLVIGGVIAAPIAAYLCKKIPTRPLLIILSFFIIILNSYNLITWLLLLNQVT